MGRKVRVLIPAMFQRRGFPARGGEMTEVPEDVAEQLVAGGYAEWPPEEKPVEQATAAPGEKRRVGRPPKVRTDED